MSRIDPDKLSNLLLDIHQSALEPEGWPAAINCLADMVDAQSSNLLMVDLASGTEVMGFLERQDPEAYRVYMRDYFPHDIRVPRMTRAHSRQILQDRDVWTETERLTSPLYHDYQRVHRLFEITGANLSTADQLIWCGFAREEERPFEDKHLDILRLVLPHVRQALRHQLERAALAAQRDLLWQHSGRALFLLTPDGRLVFCNAAAEALAGADLYRLAGGRLVFADGHVQDQFARALAAVSRGKAVPAACHAVLVSGSTSGRQFGLRLIATEHAGGVALLGMLSPLDETGFAQSELERFAALFALTAAEIRVVSAVAAGRPLDGLAADLGIQPDTVRKQLKSAMAKAGCRSQKDLIRMIERFCFLALR
jgi:DNA-binding CsgD family transcriptional regulator/PAS domain-containing protein